MNIQFYLEKLKNSDIFRSFIAENPNAFLCSGFFVLDKQKKENNTQMHFDYFVPEKNEMFSFKFESGIEKSRIENILGKVEKISEDFSLDFSRIEELIQVKMESEKITSNIQKILLSFQNKNGRSYLIGTIFISAFGLIKIQIDASEMKILCFEKKSLLDLVRFTDKKEK